MLWRNEGNYLGKYLDYDGLVRMHIKDFTQYFFLIVLIVFATPAKHSEK